MATTPAATRRSAAVLASAAHDVASLDHAAARVALVADRWGTPPAGGCAAISVRLTYDASLALSTCLERTLARLRREAARRGADRVLGFEIEVDPFGERLEFRARGLAVRGLPGRQAPKHRRPT